MENLAGERKDQRNREAHSQEHSSGPFFIQIVFALPSQAKPSQKKITVVWQLSSLPPSMHAFVQVCRASWSLHCLCTWELCTACFSCCGADWAPEAKLAAALITFFIWFFFSIAVLLSRTELQNYICSSVCHNLEWVTRGESKTQFPKLREMNASTGAALCLSRPGFLSLTISICFQEEQG